MLFVSSDYVLGSSNTIEGLGWPKWDLVLSLFVCWIIVFACLCIGVKSSGKVGEW